MGDVTGNWTAPNPLAEFTQQKTEPLVDAVTVRMPNVYGTQGQIIAVPVSVSDTTAKAVLVYDFELAFDSSILQLDSIEPVGKTGTISNQLSVTSNPNLSSRLLVSAFGIQPITGAGTILNLRFRVIGQAGQVSPLTFQRFLANENSALTVTQNGQIQVSRRLPPMLRWQGESQRGKAAASQTSSLVSQTSPVIHARHAVIRSASTVLKHSKSVKHTRFQCIRNDFRSTNQCAWSASAMN